MSFTLCSEHEGEKQFFGSTSRNGNICVGKGVGIPYMTPSTFWNSYQTVSVLLTLKLKETRWGRICVWLCVIVCVSVSVWVWQELTKDVRALCWVCRDRWEVLSTSVQETAFKSWTSNADFLLLGFLHTHVYSRKCFYFCYCQC